VSNSRIGERAPSDAGERDISTARTEKKISAAVPRASMVNEVGGVPLPLVKAIYAANPKTVTNWAIRSEAGPDNFEDAQRA